MKTKKFFLQPFSDANVQLSLQSHLMLIRAITQQIKALEKAIMAQVEPTSGAEDLKTAPGIGDILAETILSETGPITRFKGPGNFAIRHSEKAKQFYEKKAKSTNSIVARKVQAHKLYRACNWILKNGEAYNEEKIFG